MVIDVINLIENIPLTILIPYIIAFFALSVASYTDIKTREVPDWANLGLIGAGFGINLLFSVIFLKINFIAASIVGFAVFFAIACLMFYAGQWGGGDSKILMGLGALIGIDIFSKSLVGLSIIQFFVAVLQFFLVGFLVNALLIGALYGILWSVFLVVKNRKNFTKTFKKLITNKKIISTKKIILVLFIVLIVVAILIPDKFIKLMVFYLALMSIMTFYVWVIIKAVENSCMLKFVKPQQLTEGDWIAKEVKIDGKYITGPKDLGISKKQINKLLSFYKQRKIKKILIKEGIPFVPSFFIAYIVTLIYGNLVFLMI